MGYSVAEGKLIHEKNQKSKISWHCPFKAEGEIELDAEPKDDRERQ